MYIIAIAWLYVALMMAVAEATNPIGSVLGALFTFLLYGLMPVALLMYLLGTPGRKRALRLRREQEHADWLASQQSGATVGSGEPDAGGKAATDAVAPVRKEP